MDVGLFNFAHELLPHVSPGKGSIYEGSRLFSYKQLQFNDKITLLVDLSLSAFNLLVVVEVGFFVDNWVSVPVLFLVFPVRS